jgi:trehalose-6-phosphate synthase
VVRKEGVTFASIDMDESEYRDFYLGFCNGALWPLFHYFVDGFRYSDNHYEAYQRTNQRYARLLLPLLEPGDIIWVHDFHLFPLAQKLREAGATQPLGLFLHIPFPNIEVLRALPVYGELLQAMLAYDVLGFQTETDRDAFRGAAAFVWGAQVLASANSVTVGGRRVITEVYPIGVDVDAIQRESSEALSTDVCKRMIAGMLGRRLMIGVDRLDYSKGWSNASAPTNDSSRLIRRTTTASRSCRSRRCRAPTCVPMPRSAAISSRPRDAPTAASRTPTGRPFAISTGTFRTTCSWASCVRGRSVSSRRCAMA